VIIDANILLYAIDLASPYHDAAAEWFEGVLNGEQRVGLPWQTLGAFLRISTHPRISARPLTTVQAQDYVDMWLALGTVWIPPATERTARIYDRLARRHSITGNLVTDGQLAALSVEFGVALVSADSDFARFPEVSWVNPLAPR